jgi:hypothetical protein
MQIIDIGICINNIDPKGIGRIRFRPYSMFVSEITMGLNYEDWDEQDPFIAIPFLPSHINIIPRREQSVKIIKYDTDKDTQNVEYIAGPYTSPHDLQTQKFTTQHKNTTYGGVIVKELKDIRNANGKFNSPVTEGTMAKEEDNAYRGNYGSDIFFTENGMQLRGGSLISKKGNTSSTLHDYPQLSKKMGKLSLKKFPKTLKPAQLSTTSTTIAVNQIKYIIEYEIDSLITPSELRLYVYKVVEGYGAQFNTDIFTENTIFSTTDNKIVKLITTGNTETVSYRMLLDGTINGAYIQTRNLLSNIDQKGLKVLDISYPDESIYPFYYRPTSSFRLNPAEVSNKILYLSKIQVRHQVGGYNLIFSKQSAAPPIETKTQVINTVEEQPNSGEQSFSNLSADRVYITSTSANVGVNVKKINFNDLNEYELTQEDYINKIDPNTYAMVRGENLYNFLVAIKNLLDSHIHNINKPLVKGDPNWVKLNELLETLRNDLLNDSIRIN